jgi:DNA-binding XRE family transcriptional regulator
MACPIGSGGFYWRDMKDTNYQRDILIKEMRDRGDKPITEIASLFGVSKQRIHQIAGTVGHSYQSKCHNNKVQDVKNNYDLSNKELAQKLNISVSNVTSLRKSCSKKHHNVSGGSALIGEKAEQKVSDILEQKGIKNTLTPFGFPYDILIEKSGNRIDVKYTSAPWNTRTQETKPLSWRIMSNSSKRNECDFFVLCSPDFSFLIIIPSFIAPHVVRFCYPPAGHGAKSRYLKYINCFSLLQ